MAQVSIIVPVYNVERYLGECLDSILSQDFEDFEIVAVDDCSQDGSSEILRQYAERDARIKIIVMPQNRGLGAARNAGLAAATGRYVWFIDSDDSIRPGSLSAIMARAEETGAEVVLFGWARTFEDGVRPGTGHALLSAA